MIELAPINARRAPEAKETESPIPKTAKYATTQSGHLGTSTRTVAGMIHSTMDRKRPELFAPALQQFCFSTETFILTFRIGNSMSGGYFAVSLPSLNAASPASEI